MDTIFEKAMRETAVNVASINDKIWIPFQIERDLKGFLYEEFCGSSDKNDFARNSPNYSFGNDPAVTVGLNASNLNVSGLNSGDDSGVDLNTSLIVNQNKREWNSIKNKKRKVSMDDFITIDEVGEVDLSDFKDFIKLHSCSKRKVNCEKNVLAA